MRTICKRLEQINHPIAYQVGSVSLDDTQQGKARFPLRKGFDRLATSFANHSVQFPNTDTFTLVYNPRMLINAHPIGQFPSTVIAAKAFTALLLAAQRFVQITASAFVSQNVFQDSFMTDLDIGVSIQPVRILL